MKDKTTLNLYRGHNPYTFPGLFAIARDLDDDIARIRKNQDMICDAVSAMEESVKACAHGVTVWTTLRGLEEIDKLLTTALFAPKWRDRRAARKRLRGMVK